MDKLSNADISDLIAFRHALHAEPELSGHEHETAARIVAALSDQQPDQILTGLGGTGVAAIWKGAEDGPTLMFRCELDAIAVQETGDRPHRSTRPTVGHLCGHDGHMVTLLALARMLHRTPPRKGRVVLLFQPAEETGAGAAAVIADARFDGIRPDLAFSLHNMPGLPLGEVRLIDGPANCASRGMELTLTGVEAHAAEPGNGVSPGPVLAELIPALTGLAHGDVTDAGFRLITVTHAQLGEPAFGIAPGRARLLATLRCLTDDGMADLVATVEGLVRASAEGHGVGHEIAYHEAFDHCDNHPEPTAILRRAMDRIGVRHSDDFPPMRASEDFGRFGQIAPAAMLFLGSGPDCPPLHNPAYDFPDSLIPTGAAIFARVVRDLL